MSKSNKIILAWVLLITLGSLTGISIIFRDVSNGFGTVTFGSIEPFELQTNTNETFSSIELSGKVWVGNGIYSNCTHEAECSAAVRMFLSICEELKDNNDIKILSFMMNKTSINNNLTLINNKCI